MAEKANRQQETPTGAAASFPLHPVDRLLELCSFACGFALAYQSPYSSDKQHDGGLRSHLQ